jgi:glycosyltransferase involved in cell wall biosynthesis
MVKVRVRKDKLNPNIESNSRKLNGVPDYAIYKLKSKVNRTALVIPVINEGQRIVSQLRKVAKINQPVDIIIADGGSSDNSIDYFLNSESGITTCLIKKGNGRLSAQLRMAFHYCLNEGYDSIITMDGNDKDDPSGIAKIMQALFEGYDFVQGSRFLNDGEAINTPIQRLLAIKFLHAPITSFASRRKYTDTTNGFRGYSAQLLSSKDVSIFRDIFNSYELLAYLPIRAANLGFRTKEVGVVRRYPDSGAMPTKINGIVSHVKILVILLKAAIKLYSPKLIEVSDAK